MDSLYRVVRPDGSVEYTDAPSGAGRIEPIRPGQTRSDSDREPREDKPYDPKLARDLIKETQKRVPKVIDYLDYLDYLRHNSPVRFDRVMAELKQQDPQTWLKLQKYPQFRSLRETAIGLKAGEKSLSAGIGLATGSFTGSAEKWMETTLKDLMKRDRFGPYAEALGRKAPMSSSKPSYYSNSRMGEYMKAEDERLAAAAKGAAKDLEGSRSALRAAKAGAVTRVMGPILDLGLNLLDVQNHGHVTSYIVEQKLVRAREAGIIDDDQYIVAHNMMSQGRYKEMDEYLRSVVVKQGAAP